VAHSKTKDFKRIPTYLALEKGTRKLAAIGDEAKKIVGRESLIMSIIDGISAPSPDGRA
jgi:actin-like ATPase involved in cell morphogenesis